MEQVPALVKCLLKDCIAAILALYPASKRDKPRPMLFPCLHAAARRYPFTRGRDRFYKVLRGPALDDYLDNLPAMQTTRRGFTIHCNPRDLTSDWIKFWGEHERLTESFLLEVLQRGGTFLDVGANVGYFSLLVAHELADLCQVVAFEPNPPIFALLQAGVNASRGAQIVRVVPLALADSAGRLEFVVEAGNTGHSHLAASGEGGSSRTVEVVVLDQWLAQFPPPSRIAAIKLDVEGCEFKALRGMERTLREHRPALVVELIEEHLRAFGDSSSEVHAFLEGIGYSVRDAAVADGNLYLRAPGPAA